MTRNMKNTKRIAIILVAALSLFAVFHKIGLLSFLFYPSEEYVLEEVMSDLSGSNIDGVQVHDILAYDGNVAITLSYDEHDVEVWTNVYNRFSISDTGIALSRIRGGPICLDS